MRSAPGGRLVFANAARSVRTCRGMSNERGSVTLLDDAVTDHETAAALMDGWRMRRCKAPEMDPSSRFRARPSRVPAETVHRFTGDGSRVRAEDLHMGGSEIIALALASFFGSSVSSRGGSSLLRGFTMTLNPRSRSSQESSTGLSSPCSWRQSRRGARHAAADQAVAGVRHCEFEPAFERVAPWPLRPASP
jgi:hypothetical protein